LTIADTYRESCGEGLSLPRPGPFLHHRFVTAEEALSLSASLHSRIVDVDSRLRSAIGEIEVFLRRSEHQAEVHRVWLAHFLPDDTTPAQSPAGRFRSRQKQRSGGISVPEAPKTIRLYRLRIDGEASVISFEHGAGMAWDELNRDLNRQFHEWLEKVAPGAHAAGRVKGISFSDLPWKD
jgi:hypothetical protein